MAGPIPEKVMGMYRNVEAIEIGSLVCLKKVSSPEREHLERKIFKVWAQYQAQLLALRQSPTRAEILDAVDEKHRQIGEMVLGLADPLPKLKPRAAADGSGARNYQFHSALDDLFEVRGYSLHGFTIAASKALEAVRAFDRIASELHALIESSQDDDVFVALSEKKFRQRLFRSLHQVLVQSGVDKGVGAKSIITLLIMELEANPRLGTDEEGKYRKGLARQIKEAVNDLEANE